MMAERAVSPQLLHVRRYVEAFRNGDLDAEMDL